MPKRGSLDLTKSIKLKDAALTTDDGLLEVECLLASLPPYQSKSFTYMHSIAVLKCKIAKGTNNESQRPLNIL